MASKNQEMAASGGAYAAEDDVSRKRLRKENGVGATLLNRLINETLPIEN